MTDILIVEDDLAIQQSFQRLFEKHGWSVAVAGDGVQALRFLEKSVPQIMLVDMLMPNMGGLELLENYKKLHGSGPQPAIIVMTNAQVPADSEKRVRELGAQEYVAKYKMAPADLVALMSRYLKR
jgi:CheY-like chemotaxis protein